MAQLTRITHKIFGSTAGTTQVAVFGSLAAGSPVFTNNVGSIQQLSNWTEGWYGAVLGGNSPAIQDLNAAFFEHSYQIGYLFQAGIPLYDASTTYYTNSFVQGSNGVIYQSLTNSNTGSNPLLGSPWTSQWISPKNLPSINYVTGPVIANFSYAGSTFTDIGSCTITTTGRPVEIRLQSVSGGSNQGAVIGISGGQESASGDLNATADFRFEGVGGSQLCMYGVKLTINANGSPSLPISGFNSVPSSSMSFIDTPAAGTITYYLAGRVRATNGSLVALSVVNTVVTAREL